MDSAVHLQQAIRVLGLLGALDPYKHKVNIGMIDQSRDASAVSLSESKSSQDSGRPVITFEVTLFLFVCLVAIYSSCVLIVFKTFFSLRHGRVLALRTPYQL